MRNSSDCDNRTFDVIALVLIKITLPGIGLEPATLRFKIEMRTTRPAELYMKIYAKLSEIRCRGSHSISNDETRTKFRILVDVPRPRN